MGGGYQAKLSPGGLDTVHIHIWKGLPGPITGYPGDLAVSPDMGGTGS
jgi:hypothetical protein